MAYEVELVNWQGPICKELARVRMRVFVDEQRVPAELELDDVDARAVHAVARDKAGVVVATGRVFDAAGGSLAMENGRVRRRGENLDAGEAAGETGPIADGGGGIAKIGRMAVMAEQRGEGCGAAILQALVRAAQEAGFSEVWLSAQCHAVPFYEKGGFTVASDEYLDCDIPHRDMMRRL